MAADEPMMEKYGVDMEDLPATDDQIRQLRALYPEYPPIGCTRNRKAAEKAIEQGELMQKYAAAGKK